MLAAGHALIVMDGTIAGVALPTMIGALDLSLTNAQWVNAIYNPRPSARRSECDASSE